MSVHEHHRKFADFLGNLRKPKQPVDFSEITIIGGRKVALCTRGDLYQWIPRDSRWVRLELTTVLIPFRRKRYAGHPLTEPDNR